MIQSYSPTWENEKKEAQGFAVMGLETCHSSQAAVLPSRDLSSSIKARKPLKSIAQLSKGQRFKQGLLLVKERGLVQVQAKTLGTTVSPKLFSPARFGAGIMKLDCPSGSWLRS